MIRLIFFVAGLLVLVLVIRKWPEPPAAQTDLHREGFTRYLLSRGEWQTRVFDYGHIHYRTDSHVTRTAELAEHAVDSARAEALTFLELRDTQRIEVFLVDSREEMAELVRQPYGGMVNSGERTAILVYNQSYAPFLTHELTHLYTHDHWGPPRNGRWISEGIAALASGDCQGYTIAQLVKGIEQDGQLHEWRAFATGFNEINEIPANLQAASMIDHLKRRGGIRLVRDLWMSEGWGVAERAFGQRLAQIESAWRTRVQATPTAARLDSVRLRHHGCVPLN